MANTIIFACMQALLEAHKKDWIKKQEELDKKLEKLIKRTGRKK